jgi:hypothetical protein
MLSLERGLGQRLSSHLVCPSLTRKEVLPTGRQKLETWKVVLVHQAWSKEVLHWWHSESVLRTRRPDGSLPIVGRKGLVADEQTVARDFDNKMTDAEEELVDQFYEGARCGILD